MVSRAGGIPVPRLPLDADASADIERTVEGEADELGPGDTQISAQGPPHAGRYVLRRWLGAGGMGAVYEARDPSLDRPVAIKLLHGSVDDEARRRMEREARALAKLSHPNVVHIYEIGRSEGRTFIAMELVRGQTLDVWREGKPAWQQCVQVYLQAGRGLAAAHAEGLVHRDFKPSNCMLGEDGRVRVLDFGLARPQQPETQRADAVDTDGGFVGLTDQLTHTGSFVGTPAYVALEQLEGRPVDEASDQFSFCVSLYEALLGERPYAGATAAELAVALASGQLRALPPAGRRMVPPRVVRILRRGLSRAPSERWPSMDALLVELRRTVTPRRRRWALGLLGGGLLATGVGLWQQARVVNQRCGGADDALVGVWDTARQQTVHEAIEATGLPYAEQTWARARTDLTRYAQQWAQMHTETCQATHVRMEQTEEVMALRMECLSSRKIRMAEAVDVLAHADQAVVERAVTLVSTLPPIARCEDVQALRAAVAPPDDAAVAQQVRGLRQRLARVSALESVGRFEEAEVQLSGLAQEAEGLGYGPMMAEIQFRRGSVLQGRGRDAEAAVRLERAFVLAVEHGHDVLAVDAASLLTFVVGVQQERTDAGEQWASTALAFARRDDDPSRLGSALANHGLVLEQAGHHEQAETVLLEALEIKERTLGGDHPDLAIVTGGLASVREGMGDIDGALRLLQRALEIHERALGAEHPYLGDHLANMGRLLAGRGEVDEGRVKLERALALFEQAGDVARAATTMHALARAYYSEGRVTEAFASMEGARTALEASVGTEHPLLGRIIGTLGLMHAEQGRRAEAEVLYRRALAIRERTLGLEHADSAGTVWNLAMLLQDQERFAEAEPLIRRAAAIYERVMGPNDVSVASAWAQLALALEGQGKRNEARRFMEIAARLFGDLAGPDPEAEANVTAVEIEQWLRDYPPVADPAQSDPARPDPTSTG